VSPTATRLRAATSGRTASATRDTLAQPGGVVRLALRGPGRQPQALSRAQAALQTATRPQAAMLTLTASATRGTLGPTAGSARRANRGRLSRLKDLLPAPAAVATGGPASLQARAPRSVGAMRDTMVPIRAQPVLRASTRTGLGRHLLARVVQGIRGLWPPQVRTRTSVYVMPATQAPTAGPARPAPRARTSWAKARRVVSSVL